MFSALLSKAGLITSEVDARHGDREMLDRQIQETMEVFTVPVPKPYTGDPLDHPQLSDIMVAKMSPNVTFA